MPDFKIHTWNFNDTTVTVECATDAAKNHTNGAISLEIRTSAVVDFYDRMSAQGFKVDWK
jgi:hypothetical protein